MSEATGHSCGDVTEGKDRHLLIAVDGSVGSAKAVFYVADLLGLFPGIRVSLLHVILLPQGEDFPGFSSREDALRAREEEAATFLERYHEVLLQGGFAPEKVKTVVLSTDREVVAETILKKHEEIGSCTIVLGRRGMSHQEEFLFGSVSSRVVHKARKCSVWVIE
jgi:nucleotide-binding universal stress UspA family protein